MTKKKVPIEVPEEAPVRKASRKVVEPEFRIDLLDNWMELNKEMRDMGEDEAMALVNAERAGRCRPAVILRLHGRYNKLRALREKSEFMVPLR